MDRVNTGWTGVGCTVPNRWTCKEMIPSLVGGIRDRNRRGDRDLAGRPVASPADSTMGSAPADPAVAYLSTRPDPNMASEASLHFDT